MRNFSTIVALLLLSVTTMYAVPAYRGALKAVQPDGTTITFYLRGDEHGHECISTDGYRLMQDKQGAYRYAKIKENKTLTCDDSPIAHNPHERKN